MSEHTRFVHELFYWIEVALAPIVCYLLYRLARFAWSMGWLDDSWPDPPAFDDEDDLISAQPPEVEADEPAPWRR